MNPSLVLASTSPYRRQLLERLHVPFVVASPSCDEDEQKNTGKPPADVAAALAELKALSVRANYPDAYILGSDQLVDLDGEILGKPGSPSGCVAQLMRMRGRSHRLITAVSLVRPDGEIRSALDIHTLTLRDLSEPEIRRYVARDQPVDCAGSYKIEQGGIALMERLQGDDFTAIMGLSLVHVTSLLRAEGFAVP